MKGSPQRDLENDMTFGDLDQRVKVTVFTRNLENANFLIIFDNTSYILHSSVMILGQKGRLWGYLKNDMTLGDLDLQSRSQYLFEIWKKAIFEHF